MSQRPVTDFPIDPDATSGIELAAIFNRFISARDTTDAGVTRPGYTEAGGLWVDNSGMSSSPAIMKIMVFDGVDDIVVASIDTDSGQVIFESGGVTTWEASRIYNAGNVATIGAYLYVAMRANVGKPPASSPSDWAEIGATDLTFYITASQIAALYYNKTETDDKYLTKTGKAADSERIDGIDSASLMRKDIDQTLTGNFTATGDITAYSDVRLKTDIETILSPLEKIRELVGVTFDRRDVDVPRQTGLIAQDVNDVIPEAVHIDDNGYMSLAYGNLVGLLVEGIKTLEARLRILERR